MIKSLTYSLLVCIFLGGCNNSNVEKPLAKPDGYHVSGTVSNNVGSGLMLKNADETLLVTGNKFSFPRQKDESSYLVTIASHPVAQSCKIINSGGKISGASISDVIVTCTSLPLNFDASIALKQLNFTWDAILGISHYKIFINPDGVSGFTPLANSGDITGNVYSHLLATHLLDQTNARFRLEAYEDQLGTPTLVSFSTDLTITGILNNVIGYLKASNTGAGDRFGSSISLSADGNTLAIGAVEEDGGDSGVVANLGNDCGSATPINCAPNSGAVYVYTRNSAGAWDHTFNNPKYIKASNPDVGDAFGTSVSLSADGNTLAVGAPYEDNADSGTYGDYNEDNRQDDDCGSATPTSCAENSGAVYVYTRTSSGIWSTNLINPYYIKSSNTVAHDYFGNSISLSADGNTLAVAASGDNSAATGINGNPVDDCESATPTNCATSSGAVYIYTRDSSWGISTNPTYIKASNTKADDSFGYSISLSADGNTLAVGASGEDSPATGINGDQSDNCMPVFGGTSCPSGSSGAVYVYTRDSSGSWEDISTYIKASNTKAGDSFGYSISLSADGNTLAVGAIGEDNAATGTGNQVDDCGDWEPINCARDSGAAYIYYRDIQGDWATTPITYIKAIYAQRFGVSLNLSADGNILAVGADWESGAAKGIGGDLLEVCPSTLIDCSLSGAAYVYTRDSTGSWAKNPIYIKASNTDRVDLFGRSISLAADGNTLAVGADWEDSAATGLGGNQVHDCGSATETNCANSSGAVYLY